ncbi:hypothetical protein KKB99_07025 [bacterium]|nr:hypothetical protein [bacterium]MBU1025743.1 hypothetical protein [bacterium]
MKENEKQLRRLSRELITSRERERSRLARDLHDELGQQLATLALEIGLLKNNGNISEKNIDELNLRVKSITEEVRRIYQGLHPHILENFGLTAAVEALIDEYNAMGIFKIVSKLCLIEKEAISPEIALHIYRILQESLRNITKHADADNVFISLDFTDSELSLVVQDDGKVSNRMKSGTNQV